MTFDLFFDQLGDIDWLGVIVATVVVSVAGAVWYGPIVGRQWAAAANVEYEAQPPPQKIVAHVITMFVFNVGLAYFLADGFEHALVMGALVIGLLLLIPFAYGAVIWQNYSRQAFMLDAPFILLLPFLGLWAQSWFL